MKRLIFTLIFVIISCISGFAQTGISACPIIKINVSESQYLAGDFISVSAERSNELQNYNARYEWEVSAGEIISGQGTDKISISTNTELSGSTITIKLAVKGLPDKCVGATSEIIPIASIPSCSGNRPIFDYGKVELEEEFAALDNIGIELLYSPTAKAFIIFEIEEKETVEQAKKHIRKLMKQIEYREYPKERFIFAIRNAEKHRTQMYLVDESADLPNCENCEILQGSDL